MLNVYSSIGEDLIWLDRVVGGSNERGSQSQMCGRNHSWSHPDHATTVWLGSIIKYKVYL